MTQGLCEGGHDLLDRPEVSDGREDGHYALVDGGQHEAEEGDVGVGGARDQDDGRQEGHEDEVQVGPEVEYFDSCQHFFHCAHE